MPRPVWSDAGLDPGAVADRLDALAADPAPLQDLQAAAVDVPLEVLHQAAILRARRQLALRHGEKDRILAQEVRAVDDLVRTANLLIERLREWYALHAPEAVRMVGDAERLARLVAEQGGRSAVLAELEQVEGLGTGADLEPADLAAVQGFAAALRAVHEAWRALEKRIEAMMTDVAPNLASVVGPMVGARLIAQAGDLERLATFPAGTVQLLGAETALFRHLKEGTRPPKHGTLFQHPLIHAAPPWQRGPIARSLAEAAALAAKADAFSGNDLRASLEERLETQLVRIRRDHAKARPRSGRPDDRGPRGKSGAPQGSGPKGSGPKRPGSKGGFGARPGAPRGGKRGPGTRSDDRREKPGRRPDDHRPEDHGATPGPDRRAEARGGTSPGPAKPGGGKPGHGQPSRGKASHGKPGAGTRGKPGGKPRKGAGAFRGDGGPAKRPGRGE